MTSPDNKSPSVLEDNLKALATHPKAPSKAALIRRYLPQIEAAQAAGATNAEIVDAFHRSDIDIPLSTFESTLSRVRRQLGKAKEHDKRQETGQQPSKLTDKAQRDAWAKEIIPDDEPPELFKRLIKKRDQEK